MSNLAITFMATLVVLAIFFSLYRFDRNGQDGEIGFFRRNGVLVGGYLVLAVAFWVILTIVMPMVYMVDLSFHHKLPPSKVGGPEDVYTLDNYRKLIFGSTTDTSSLNWLHLRSFLMTIGISILLTLLTFAICYPVSYYMAQSATSQKLRIVLLLLIIPYWVNDILRAFAFRIMLAENGFMNNLLDWLGLINAPIDFLGANAALYIEPAPLKWSTHEA
ncbi:hypothetical protein AYJ57_17980 [Salipiger sp. CCB-MM3]|uniref:ABC transporter permease n=1 Tax=Salipiger sp. CCB-MM3 TaxID=1792508 RepID=UPI00080ABB8B|nr:hypothetical protein [Salipiger sp. CCB-MM3]ANT62310.1 hypothetical protein AYJ57_17980 [Salipiger sp. CCB-MM3]